MNLLRFTTIIIVRVRINDHQIAADYQTEHFKNIYRAKIKALS